MTAEPITTSRRSLTEALDQFDNAPAVDPAFMIGTWRGAEIRTGHPMDGYLEPSGWWGKAFLDTENVHPLLFPSKDGHHLWALNPGLMPVAPMLKVPALRPRRSVAGLMIALRPLLQTRRPRARLRTVRYRGVDTAAMVYDQLPIIDVFRKLSDDTVIGAMDVRGSEDRPYFFVLQRDNSLPLS